MYADERRTRRIATLHTLRQQLARDGEHPNHALADFVAPDGVGDHVGAFAVTTGLCERERAEQFEREHDDYGAILFKALCDRLAEAFAERMHERVRRELWGYAPDEAFTTVELIAERYQGSGRRRAEQAAAPSTRVPRSACSRASSTRHVRPRRHR